MLKNESINQSFARYGMFFCLIGTVSQFIMYPEGMYINFMCGCIAVTLGILAKRIDRRTRFSSFDIFFGILSIIFSFIIFYGLLNIYRIVSDPIHGPQYMELLYKMMNEYGISIDEFARIMQ